MRDAKVPKEVLEAYNADRTKYETKARAWTRKYAM